MSEGVREGRKAVDLSTLVGIRVLVVQGLEGGSSE